MEGAAHNGGKIRNQLKRVSFPTTIRDEQEGRVQEGCATE